MGEGGFSGGSTAHIQGNEGIDRTGTDLSCVFFNARSIMNKLQWLEITMEALDPDVIGITESWCNDRVLEAELAMDGYDLFRSDRGGGLRGGGVLLYARSSLRAVLYKTKCQDGEHICCKLTSSRGNELIIGVIYRSANIQLLNLDTNLTTRQLIRELSPKNFILMGDFNYPDIDWENHTGVALSSQQFVECLEDGFLTQHVVVPTRGASCLDLIITRDPDLVSDVENIGQFLNSDHCVIRCKIRNSNSKTTTLKGRLDYARADFDKIRREIGGITWSLGESAGDAWEDFKSKILDVEKRLVPKASERKKKKSIWMNHKAVNAVKHKHRVYAKYKRSDHPAYIKAEKNANMEVESARKAFETGLAKNIKSDVKSFYAYARSKSKTKVGVGPLEDDVGSLITSDEGMCEIFNEYFATVFTDEDLTNVPDAEQMWKGSREESLSEIIIDTKTVEDRLSKLRADKSTGADDLSPRLLKEIQKEIIKPTVYIWNKSLEEGDVPYDWKISNVCPIFKKGSRSKASNYRPVSLTSQMGKLLESVIRDAMVDHLESNGLIKDSQHGFRRGRSCLSNVLTYLDKATRLVDRGQSCDAVYLDFEKAFDKVPFERLLRKIEAHGITGKLLKWIGEWLRGRKQRVCIGGSRSGWREVTSGVPQGSVLGPVLFLIYINDLDTGILSWILKFADDTKLLAQVDSPRERDRLQADLDRLGEWSSKWQMRFNAEKCKIIHMGRGNSKYKYYLDNVELDETGEERDLGILITKDLKASSQCNAAYKKASRILGMMSRTIKYKNKETLLCLYKSLVRPLLEYCTPAWSPHYVKDKDILERVQHRFTRMIPGLARIDYKARLGVLKIWSLEERRNRADMIETFKIMKGLSAIPAHEIFELSTVKSTRGHTLKLAKHRCSTDLRKYFFSERVVDGWNGLDQGCVDAQTVNQFKQHLDRMRRTRMASFADP